MIAEKTSRVESKNNRVYVYVIIKALSILNVAVEIIEGILFIKFLKIIFYFLVIYSSVGR